MDHKRIKELLPLYIDKGLREDEMRKIDEHLKNCSSCRAEVEDLKNNLNYLKKSSKIKAPDILMENVMGNINGEKKDSKFQEENYSNIIKRTKDFFAEKNLRTVYPAAAALLIFLIVLSFGGNNFTHYFSTQNYRPEYDLNGAAKNVYKNQNLNFASDSVLNSRTLSVNEAEQQNNIKLQRKIIQTAVIDLEMEELDNIEEKINKIVQRYNAYISESRNWVDSNDKKNIYYNLRVPSENFSAVKNEVSLLAEVTSSHISSRDVTEEFVDVEARLKNLKLQEQRYRDLLNRADEVEDILKVERELERIRGNIESLEGRMNYLKDQVSLSTLEINISQPTPITGGEWGFVKAIQNSVKAMAESFYNLIIKLGSSLPYLLLFAFLYFAFKTIQRKRKN
ncbi:MAG: DUF4349 domain-containing protein [Bacillota bacterium]